MHSLQFELLKNQQEPGVIADWYSDEWKIPREKTIARIADVTKSDSQFQALMSLNGQPIGTGGLYTRVGILEHHPRFEIYKNWLALVYTTPAHRGKGYGSALCRFIQQQAREKNISEMFLFTDTAESLYRQLGWTALEKVTMGKRNVVVMKLELNNA